MPTEVSMSERWYWLDWLRVISMGAIFLYHSGMPFVSYDNWHITNSQPDSVISLFNQLMISWIMPLFFVVSGIATYLSLSKRSPWQFAWERFERLMIPFILTGLLLILPIHVYFDSIFHGTFSGNFQNFYLGPYFTEFFPFDSDFSLTYFADSNQGIYLWYIFWLFVFSLVATNFFKWLKKEENSVRISRLAMITNRPGGIFLLTIPVIIVNVVTMPPFFVFPTGYGGGKLPTYLAFFVTAYLLATNSQFGESIEKNRVLALLLGVATTLFNIYFLVTFGLEAFGSTVPVYYITVSVFWALNGWSWVITILGFGHKHLSFNHRFLGFSNELVLPFYILHQTIIVAISFFVVSLDLIPIEKYFIIILASFSILSILLFLIRQFNLLRFLFGMRSQKGRANSARQDK